MGNNQIKQKYINQINEGIEYDAYKLFDLPREFTWDQLKNAYKKLAIKSHPDKGGNKILFDYVTKKFYELSNDYKMRTDNKNFNELKEGYNTYNENNNDQGKYNDKFEDGLSFNERLNKHFDSVKIYDDDKDFGYGNTMENSSTIRDDIKIKNLFNTSKVNNKSFNEVFDKSVKLSTKEVIKYNDPAPMILAKNLAFSEIGAGKNDDYSSSLEKSKNLAYTDYMKAHTTNRLIDSSELTNIKQFKDVKEYKKYSDNKIKKGLSNKELKQLDIKKMKDDEKEIERLDRIKKQNIDISIAYEKANNLLLRK